MGSQAKLLRVLEDRKVRRLGGKIDLPVEVRVIAATNKIPEEAIRNKLLREDLFYRLNVFNIHLPPLRDRKSDIAPITDAIVADLNKKHGCRVTGLHPVALEHLQNSSWPGNVRELRNVLERAVILAGEGLILTKHLAMEAQNLNPRIPLPQSTRKRTNRSASHPGATMEEIEDAYIDLILRRTNNNKTKAAEILGISVRTLHNRLGQTSKGKATGATG